MSVSPCVPAEPPGAAQTVLLPSALAMRRGGGLREVEIAYECWGRLNAARDNAVLLFTGLSPSAHAASSANDPSPGWWEYMIGPGKPIDTRRLFVVCVNSLGSCFGSTGPASCNPDTGRPYRLDFPELTIEDIARAGNEVVKAFDIERLYAVAGASMGGMTALAYAIEYGETVANLVAISAAARASAFAISVRSLQREIIRDDPLWRGGDYAPGEGPQQGMRLARKLGMISYRSGQEWEQRFGHRKSKDRTAERPFGVDFEVESYLDHHARKFVGGFDANCYLYLSRAMDLFDAAEHGASLEAGLARVRARRALVVGVQSDILFPLHQQAEIAAGLRQAGCTVDYHALDSINGHDSFLIDEARFAPVVAEFFAER